MFKIIAILCNHNHKTMKHLFLILTIFTALFSCKSSQLESSGTPLRIKELNSGYSSGYTTPSNIEIRNLKELNSVWGQLFIKFDRKSPIPNIDFENKMLVD